MSFDLKKKPAALLMLSTLLMAQSGDAASIAAEMALRDEKRGRDIECRAYFQATKRPKEPCAVGKS